MQIALAALGEDGKRVAYKIDTLIVLHAAPFSPPKGWQKKNDTLDYSVISSFIALCLAK